MTHQILMRCMINALYVPQTKSYYFRFVFSPCSHHISFTNPLPILPILLSTSLPVYRFFVSLSSWNGQHHETNYSHRFMCIQFSRPQYERKNLEEKKVRAEWKKRMRKAFWRQPTVSNMNFRWYICCWCLWCERILPIKQYTQLHIHRRIWRAYTICLVIDVNILHLFSVISFVAFYAFTKDAVFVCLRAMSSKMIGATAILCRLFYFIFFLFVDKIEFLSASRLVLIQIVFIHS